MNVIAKVRFRSVDRVTERVVDYGVWLNSSCNSTDIGIGDTRELVLMCVMDEGLVTFGDRRIDDHKIFPDFSWMEDGNVDALGMIGVTLIDPDTQATLNYKVRVWRDGQRFCVAER